MSSTSIGEIGLDLVVNQKQFNKQMSGIAGLAKKVGAALAAAFATKKIVDFGKQCLQLGSDLAEVQNVVDVTFPSMTAKVDDFAKSAASSFGLSETMAKQFTGVFGAMAKQFGFSEQAAYDMGTTLTGLAGDVASFYNISQNEAYTKLKSVFTGEMESLKDLGVVMTQSALDAYALANGYGKTTQAMSEAEKVALRYAFVQDQLSAVQGDFARTSDSWANQVRILNLQFDSLKATIGQGLINLFTPVIKVVNTLIGKLATLAGAFKSFTELITGQKSSGTGDIKNTAAGLDAAAESAGNLADNTADAGSAAKKAAKEMRALMGFDKINKLDKPDSGDSSGGGAAAVGAPGTVDFGSLAQGETVVDKLDQRMQGLINRGKELAGLFKKGFLVGFGDSEKRIVSLQGHIRGIGKSLKGIFTDSSVINAANTMFDKLAINVGKMAGSCVNIGVTIATNLIGGIDLYLSQSKDYIKNELVSIFDVTGEITDLIGDFSTAFADIFSIFGGETAQQCTSDIIGIFSDGFLGVIDISLKFARDIISVITGPFVDNKDKIKETVENTLQPISIILSTLHDSVKKTFEKIGNVYDEHVKPMFDAFRDGFSEIVGTLLDGYNEYIAPVLDEFSKKFKETWDAYIQPAIDKGIELFGKLADAVTDVWVTTLQPFLNWIAKNIMPVIAPILEGVGKCFLELMKTVGKVASDIFDALGGIIDFVAGVFTGDWKRAWKGIKTFFESIWDALEDCVKGPVNAIIGLLNGLIEGLATAVNTVADMFNNLQIDIPDWVPVFGGGTLGFNLPTWTPPQIPYLAQGGFVKPNTPQLAMIGDNRHQGEVVAPEDKMQEMAENAVRMAMAGYDRITKEDLEAIVNNAVLRIVAALAEIGFYIDGERLATAQNRAQTALNRRWNTVTIE